MITLVLLIILIFVHYQNIKMNISMNNQFQKLLITKYSSRKDYLKYLNEVNISLKINKLLNNKVSPNFPRLINYKIFNNLKEIEKTKKNIKTKHFIKYSKYLKTDTKDLGILFRYYKLYNTLNNLIKTYSFNIDSIKSFLFQITSSIYCINSKLGFIHSDIHSSNIMYNIINESGYWIYTYNKVEYYVPNYGHQFYLIDFGSVKKIDNKKVLTSYDIIKVIGLIIPSKFSYLNLYFISLIRNSDLDFEKYFQMINTDFNSIYKKAVFNFNTKKYNPLLYKFINFITNNNYLNKYNTKNILLFIELNKLLSEHDTIYSQLMIDTPYINYKHSKSIEKLLNIYYNIILYSDEELTFNKIINLTFKDYKKKRRGKCLGRFNLDY